MKYYFFEQTAPLPLLLMRGMMSGSDDDSVL